MLNATKLDYRPVVPVQIDVTGMNQFAENERGLSRPEHQLIKFCQRQGFGPGWDGFLGGRAAPS